MQQREDIDYEVTVPRREVIAHSCHRQGLLIRLTFQMLLVGSTRYFARGMEMGIHRDPADRIFILLKVTSLPPRYDRIWWARYARLKYTGAYALTKGVK